MLPLYETHRPREWSDVVGQDQAISKISVLRRRGLGGRAFFITGPSGCGKTTIARIIASEVADDYAVVEIDAQRLGLEKVREFDRMCQCRPLGEKGHHAFIVNEVHSLSSKTVSELQTVLESRHVQRTSTWVFTTTDDGQKRMFDTKFDAVPFLSRAIKIELSADVTAFATNAQQIAETEDLGGATLNEFVELAHLHSCNLRGMLQAVESGDMLRDRETSALNNLMKLIST